MDATRGRLNSTNGPVEDLAGPSVMPLDLAVPSRHAARVIGSSVAGDSSSDGNVSQMVCGGHDPDVDMLLVGDSDVAGEGAIGAAVEDGDNDTDDDGVLDESCSRRSLKRCNP